MKSLLTFFALCVWAAANAQSGGFDLKGLAFGASETDLYKRFPLARCTNRESSVEDRGCLVPRETFGGAKAELFVSLIEDKVAGWQVSLSSEDFLVVAAAMQERFGPPSKKKTEVLTNRMGAKFENTILTWTRPGERLVAQRYAGTTEEAKVTAMSEAGQKATRGRTAENLKKRAGDM